MKEKESKEKMMSGKVEEEQKKLMVDKGNGKRRISKWSRRKTREKNEAIEKVEERKNKIRESREVGAQKERDRRGIR